MKIIRFSFTPRPSVSDDVARRLTAEFLDGSTTPSDEKKLYAYYARKTVASDLECYRQMFAWYAALERSEHQALPIWHNRRFIASAAAIVMLALVGAGLLIGSAVTSNDMPEHNLYAGSYIIRNGHKITDIDEILPELRWADRYVDSTLSATKYEFPDDPEQQILDDAIRHITDPDVRAVLLADLN